MVDFFDLIAHRFNPGTYGR